ncbi:hypothetical protein EG827_06210 [bacterium]|nr:hypothetical protein [bacterium]
MEQESIIDYKKLEVRRVRKPDGDIISLLKETVLGSEGGMRYSMQNTEERIKSYGDGLTFMALYKKNSLKGVIGVCRRQTLNRGVRINSAYLRYLAIQSAFQTERAPGQRKEKLMQAGDNFKHRILSLIRDPQHATGEEHDKEAPHVMYAYVESQNERSRNMINQSGYEYIRSFLTVAFSRFNPKPDPSVALLKPEEEPAMARLLEEQYRDYCFYSDEFSFYDHKYYVLRKNGEIVAGVGAIPAQYKVVNVPGVWGWLMMKVLPRTPMFRRLFRPEEFRYVILNAIYCRKGSEELLPDLFEAVCAEEGYHTALTWLDDHSWLYETLRTNRRMGALNRMLNAKPGLVYALFTGFPAGETEKFYESPAYISGFDFS